MRAIIFCGESEARPFLRKYERGRFEGIKEGEFLHDDKVAIAITGIGKIKAALRTERMLNKIAITSLYHPGTCTGLSPDIELGALVGITEVFEGDRIELSSPTYPRMPISATPGLSACTLVTQDHTPSGTKELSYWQRIANCSDMSGYAVAYVAATFGIPCHIFKSVTGIQFKDNEHLHQTLEKGYADLAQKMLQLLQAAELDKK